MNQCCPWSCIRNYYFDGLVQDCSNSSALAMELLQSCAKPSTWWRHDVETLSALLIFVKGNHQSRVGFHRKWPKELWRVLCCKMSNKQSSWRRFGRPRHLCEITAMNSTWPTNWMLVVCSILQNALSHDLTKNISRMITIVYSFGEISESVLPRWLPNCKSIKTF